MNLVCYKIECATDYGGDELIRLALYLFFLHKRAIMVYTLKITIFSVFLGVRVPSRSRRGWGSCSCGQCRDRGRCSSRRCSGGNRNLSFGEEIHVQAYCEYSLFTELMAKERTPR